MRYLFALIIYLLVMKKTITTFFLLAVITGTVFTGCTGKSIENALVEEVAEKDGVTVTTVKYENGVYEAIGIYQSPAEEESIEVKLTLEEDVVTAVEVVGMGTHEVTMKLQGLFIEEIGAEVVGMKLDEIPEFDQVNGSSLTPIGFADALEEVKKEALSVSS